MRRTNLLRSLCESNLFRSRYWWLVTLILGWYSFLGHVQTPDSTAHSIVHPSNTSNSEEIGSSWPVRILCWVPISTNSKSRADLIQKTWGKQCDALLFMSSKSDPTIPSIGLPVEDSYNTLWGKTYEGLKYIYDHNLDDADWFFKADDDTLCNDQGDGTAFIERVYDKHFDICVLGPNGEEDSYLAMCLEILDILFGDSRDPNGSERFLQLSLHNLYRPWDYQATLRAFFQSKSGLDCCSNETISFHPVKDEQLLEYDYLVSYRQLNTH